MSARSELPRAHSQPCHHRFPIRPGLKLYGRWWRIDSDYFPRQEKIAVVAAILLFTVVLAIFGHRVAAFIVVAVCFAITMIVRNGPGSVNVAHGFYGQLRTFEEGFDALPARKQHQRKDLRFWSRFLRTRRSGVRISPSAPYFSATYPLSSSRDKANCPCSVRVLKNREQNFLGSDEVWRAVARGSCTPGPRQKHAFQKRIAREGIVLCIPVRPLRLAGPRGERWVVGGSMKLARTILGDTRLLFAETANSRTCP